jgi:threonine aldolase
MVLPRMVFISNSTELGTVYTLDELKKLSRLCRERGLILYLDGARLGSALCCGEGYPGLADYAELCDMFYIGGTKNAFLFGEALVVSNKDALRDFSFAVKQQGALFAKGRLLGVQFKAAFEDGLYFETAGHANQMAQKLKKGLADLGVEFLTDSPSNQLFPVIKNDCLEKLGQLAVFSKQEKLGADKTCVRMVTSWQTDEGGIDRFLELAKEIL